MRHCVIFERNATKGAKMKDMKKQIERVHAFYKWIGKDIESVNNDEKVFKYQGKHYVVISDEELMEKGKEFFYQLYGDASREGNFYIYTVL
jgi:archaellum component FlaC